VTDSYSPEPKRGRPTNAEREARATRSEEVQQRRRRRESLGYDRELKLHVPEIDKDPNKVYRWVNARDGRMRRLTKEDDWDVVSGFSGDDPAKNVSEGTVTTRVADQFTGENMVLLSKPKEFFEEDKRAKLAKLKALDETMKAGPAPSADGISNSDNVYVPGGRNQISHG
jgi:hypothetical protein